MSQRISACISRTVVSAGILIEESAGLKKLVTSTTSPNDARLHFSQFEEGRNPCASRLHPTWSQPVFRQAQNLPGVQLWVSYSLHRLARVRIVRHRRDQHLVLVDELVQNSFLRLCKDDCKVLRQ